MENPRHPTALVYRFDDVVIDRDNFRVCKETQQKSLTPRAFDLLVYLIEQRGRVVEKQELFERVWKETFVTDNALMRAVKEIRRELGDDAAAPRYVETVHKRGYRFIAELQEAEDEQSAAESTPPVDSLSPASAEMAAAPPADVTSRNARRRPPGTIVVFALLLLTLASAGLYLGFKSAPHAESLAVLPFSSDAQTEYLSDGITESLINNLSRLSNLRVTARATAFSYKGKEVNSRRVGQELNVGTVLTGSVALRGDLLTVQVEMVDAATGTQKWGDRYQHKLSDIFAVQEEIGRQITEKLRLRLSGEERRQLTRRHTDNAEVYQLYLLGFYLFNKKSEDGIRRAADYFQQAIAKDPNYAPAYIGLANCYVPLSSEVGPRELLPKAKAAAIKALEIDNNLAEAHSALGWIKWIYDLDRAGAETEFEQALKLNPNSADARYRYARLLADTGRFEEAQHQARRAIDLDPLSIQYRKGIPYILYLSRRYDDAITEYRKLIRIAPDFVQIQRELGLAYEQKGLYEEAFSQLQRTYDMPEIYGRTMLRADIGHLYAVWGKRAEAEQVLAELIRKSGQGYVSAYDLAVIYAGLGETEQSFVWLDKAVEQRPFWLCWLKLDPRLDGLRRDPRFGNLLQRTGFTR